MILLLLAAASPPPPPPITAREVVEMQLEARPRDERPITGAEAQRLRKRYLDRIGQMLEPRRAIGEGTTGR